jgi:hypothetical protein
VAAAVPGDHGLASPGPHTRKGRRHRGEAGRRRGGLPELPLDLDASAFLIVEWRSSGSPAHIRARRQTSTHRGIAPFGARGLDDSKTDTAPPASTSTSREGYLIFYDAYDPDAHGKFLRWRERHLSGYVISRRSPSDAMIHQAGCGHFEFGDESVSLTKTMKICSASRRELEAWAHENMKAGLRWCRSCM